MSSVISIAPLDDILEDIPGAREFVDQINQYDVTVLKRTHVRDIIVTNDYNGRLVVKLALAVEGATTLVFPNLEFIRILLGVTVPGFTFITGNLTIGDDGYLELYDFRLALAIEQPLLRRYDLEKHQILPEPFRFEIDAYLTIDVKLDFYFRLYNFSIPTFAIEKTGLIIALEDCQLDLGGDWSSAGLKEMLDAPEFNGIYAQKALLYWIPQFKSPAFFENIPGLRLEFNDVAWDQDGISFAFDLNWQVVTNNGVISTDSELYGNLFDNHLTVALANARGRVVRNLPEALTVSGLLQIPFVNVLMHADFSLEDDFETDTFITTLTLTAEPDEIPQLNLGNPAWSIALPELYLHSELKQDSLMIQGVTGIQVRLPGLSVDTASVDILFSTTQMGEIFSFQLEDFSLGPMGMVEKGELRVLTKRTLDNQTVLNEFFLEMEYSWQELSNRLGLDNLPNEFPLPPDDARITVKLRWSTSGIFLSFSADVADPTSLWRFLPQGYRPQVRDFRFVCEVSYADEADFNAQTPGSNFQGQLIASLQARLPQALNTLPTDLLILSAGDGDGWISLALAAGFRPDLGGNDVPYMELLIENPVSMLLFLPGLELSLPLIEAHITRISLDLAASTTGEGELLLTGDFVMRPPLPPPSLPMAEPLRILFKELHHQQLSGHLELKVAFAGNLVKASFSGTFDQAGLKFGIFEMLGVLAPIKGEEYSVPLDIEVGFSLKEIALQAGTLDQAQPNQLSFSLGMEFRCGGIFQDVALVLSQQEFSLALIRTEIPLTIPEFPLDFADINILQTDNDWTNFYVQLGNEITAIGRPNNVVQRRRLSSLATKRAMIGGIGAIRSQLHTQQSKDNYQLYVATVCGVLHAATSPFYTENPAYLVIENASFRIPFDNPANLSLQGEAHFEGDFTADSNHPMHWLNGISLSLGISPETIFFSFNSDQSIPLPDFGRYHGGSLHLAHLMIGYGFTKNSLAFAFDGKLVLPERLLEDLDTSDQIGIGVRFPRNSALSLKLDIIPIPVGPVTIPAPLIRFDLDLRSPGSVGLLSTSNCQPHWDGLQIIVDDIYHDGFKRLAISPLFTVLPIPNLQFSGAIQVGNKHTGFTQVYDNLLVLFGLMSGPAPIPIPYFADPSTPYFDNLCLNFRLAGFEINCNLQRPFPTLNPLVLFEVLGLLADPMMPLSPNGGLANLLRVSLTDAVVRVPPWALQLFPELMGVADKRLNVTISIGTFITFFQQVVVAFQQAGDALGKLTDSIGDIQKRLQNLNVPIDMVGLMRLLPPDLRKFRVGGKLAGFEARVVLVLITPDETNHAFQRKANGESPPVIISPPSLMPDPNHRLQLPAISQANHIKPNVPAGRVRQSEGSDALVLIQGREFNQFTQEDLRALSPVPKNTDGVLVGAYVRLFTGQRFRFIGYLFENGAFELVSAFEQKPLILNVVGIDIGIPFELSTRMNLQGRARRGRVSGSLIARGHSKWQPLPGNVLNLSVGAGEHVVIRGETVESIAAHYRLNSAEIRHTNLRLLMPGSQPSVGQILRLPSARLELNSDGKFRLHGCAHLSLFNTGAELSGWADISHTHAFAGGLFKYSAGKIDGVDIIRMELECDIKIYSSSQFVLQGDGKLILLGKSLTSVRGRLTQDSTEIEAKLEVRDWLIADSQLDLLLKGKIDLNKKLQPAFAFEGKGYWQVGKARVSGVGGIVKDNARAMRTYVDGELIWLGRPWLGGRMEFDGRSSLLTLTGRVHIAVNLTPDQLPNGINLAALFLQMDLETVFQFNDQSNFMSASLKGNWTLGVRLNRNSEQILPIAMQVINIKLTSGQIEGNLLHVSGFKLLPFNDLNDVKIPIPILEPKRNGRKVEFGKAGGNDAMKFSDLTLEFENVPLLPSQILGVSMPRVVVPRLTNASLTETFGEIPLETEVVWKNLDLALNSEFFVDLIWRDGQLQLKLSSNHNDKYMAI